MIPDQRFRNQTAEFWANVRTISQEVGYTRRKPTAKRVAGAKRKPPAKRAAGAKRESGEILVPTIVEVKDAFAKLALNPHRIVDGADQLTEFGTALIDYFVFRAHALNNTVRPNLMDKKAAKTLFDRLRRELNPRCHLPMNKQKGDKKNHAYLTGIVNMIVEANIGDALCNYDPRTLTTITHEGMPLRTLSRRVDGAFPSPVDPIAIWEIKEYYNTKTFGSRVADGVYETLLDGYELQELDVSAGRRVHHVLVVDDYFTWWDCGRSYLCRIVDMLHMGFLDEVLFGREVIDRLPLLAQGWKAELERLQQKAKAK